jgi:hypothetical protein
MTGLLTLVTNRWVNSRPNKKGPRAVMSLKSRPLCHRKGSTPMRKREPSLTTSLA